MFSSPITILSPDSPALNHLFSPSLQTGTAIREGDKMFSSPIIILLPDSPVLNHLFFSSPQTRTTSLPTRRVGWMGGRVCACSCGSVSSRTGSTPGCAWTASCLALAASTSPSTTTSPPPRSIKKATRRAYYHHRRHHRITTTTSSLSRSCRGS